jgi:hypothetical protein
MKKQFLKKVFNYFLPVLSILFISSLTQSARAQITNAEGPPRPGYFCRCGLPDYGCSGSSACRLRCTAACRQPKAISTPPLKAPVPTLYTGFNLFSPCASEISGKYYS